MGETKMKTCEDCKGSGAKDDKITLDKDGDAVADECPSCDGTGQK